MDMGLNEDLGPHAVFFPGCEGRSADRGCNNNMQHHPNNVACIRNVALAIEHGSIHPPPGKVFPETDM